VSVPTGRGQAGRRIKSRAADRGNQPGASRIAKSGQMFDRAAPDRRSSEAGAPRNEMGGFLSAENDVGGVLGRLMFGDAIAKRRQVDSSEHRFALPKHDR
jgi:hypothetical protein